MKENTSENNTQQHVRQFRLLLCGLGSVGKRTLLHRVDAPNEITKLRKAHEFGRARLLPPLALPPFPINRGFVQFSVQIIGTGALSVLRDILSACVDRTGIPDGAILMVDLKRGKCHGGLKTQHYIQLRVDDSKTKLGNNFPIVLCGTMADYSRTSGVASSPCNSRRPALFLVGTAFHVRWAIGTNDGTHSHFLWACAPVPGFEHVVRREQVETDERWYQ